MPLRDHFHGALRDEFEWESFHSAWANTVVRRLNAGRLPARYRSAPHVRLGAFVEVDVASFEQEQRLGVEATADGLSGGRRDRPLDAASAGSHVHRRFARSRHL